VAEQRAGCEGAPPDPRRSLITYLQGAILGVLQGFAEPFPISSLGHGVILPRLLGWDRARIRARVDELLGLVGLEPAQFRDRYPTWAFIDNIGDRWITRLSFGVLYTIFYIVYATHWWMFLLLPIHYLMGPIHGAIVNWCGHKYGYSNFDNDDHSKNTFPLDFLMLGELFQNNHHKKPNDANFAKRWFEFDPSYVVIKVLNALRIIKLRKS